ncbi:fumarylacetoacetate hydrolase family protein [Alicyclobacillus sp. SO9]|uniref:fumarylacetoacetate hydrolase family protein n=1 Tax=Alicyclobacillus sp. SO9 TaxID=2665646 RepID=UPI0018E70634|nr:fumarylacetoacetate hydrolase family protein [Alicyclobacillus sp. SO9]QQE77430.1 fumarylacetoacetate hydrolase family protein [Alicyclobacillus sp. SO9]
MGAFSKPKLMYIGAKEAQHRIRNVYCVGRNYVNHAKELGNDVPERPMIFGKPTHALVPCRNTVALPEGRKNIHHELEIVLYIHRDYEHSVSLSELIGGVALGLDLTDRDMQSELKAKGHPWELAKGFKHSAIITDFYQVVDWDVLLETPFSLVKNDEMVQQGKASETIFSFEQLTKYVGEHFGLAAGDILYTGTPAGVGSVKPGDNLSLHFDEEEWGTVEFV